MMRVKHVLFTVMVSLLFMGQAMGQTRISGRVISGEDKSPLLGANVLVKNTTRGTTTDQDGRFVLDGVTPTDVLVVTYIGFIKQEVTVGNRQTIGITMTPQALPGEAVVVIGYGTQQRRDITSAVSSLQDYAFNQGVTTDPQNLLQARIPGVVVTQVNGDVGSAPLIRIRGGTSVSASNEPMIVIDGVPVSNASASPGGPGNGDVIGTNPIDTPLSTLNPSDIASIDVLKDASSAAIYGARGGNGVILITTKRGRPGGYSLTYDGYTSTASQSKKLNLMTAQEYRNFARTLGVAVEGNADTDWQDAIVRTAISHNHNLTFSSGTEATQYLASLNYLDEEGIVIGSERTRIAGRLNLDHAMFENKLRLGVRFNPSFIKRHNTPYPQEGGFEGGVFTQVYKMIPTQPVRLSNGAYFEYPNPGIRNPVALVENIEDETETMRLFLNTTVEYDFFSSLTGKINLGLDRTNATRSIYQPRSLPYAASFGGRADDRSNQNQNVLFEGTLNYRKNITASQKLEAWAGYTFQEFEDQSFGATAQGFVTDAWSFNNLGGGSDFSVRPYSYMAKNRLISFLGRVNYNISDKYLLSAALRREGSSRFGADNKWGMFPSASVGWRLSQESFLKNSNTIDDLKLRVSYGVTGNQDIGNFRSLLILGPGANAVIGDQVRTGVAPTQLANPDLKWEETSQLNIGVDFGLWNDRFSGSIDWYNKKTTDLLLEFTVPQPAVVSTRLDNVGEVTNKGLEISLNTVNIATGGFFWRTSFNFATNKNEVVDLGGRASIIYGRVSGAGLSDVQAQIAIKGMPLGTFFGPKFLGYDAAGNEILSTDPGRPERNTGPLKDGRQFLGDAQPDYTFGISNSLNYKNFDLRVFVQGVQGNKILNNTRLEYQRASNVRNGINFFQDALDDVKAGLNPDATVHFSDRFIEDGSFIRLQNVTLGYTFPANWFPSLRSLRGYISADNLFVITDYKGYDPEVNNVAVFNGVYAQGIDYANYPRARTFSFGVNLGF
ncbi:MAG: TonB-dependent receptor [candidate division KSB1 bacterium]|nr:TonB-dependent receptor [candidate division KSB1 bacterium]MDZ7364800.1 TonB-dependent receptor [candidate division KSB1 bacterium]MDZ7402903.1 TonB-dependent receptor [candidate division KSB1 bacterium]